MERLYTILAQYIDCNTHTKSLDAEETYRYLGMEEDTGINQQMMKERIKKERILSKSETNFEDSVKCKKQNIGN